MSWNYRMVEIRPKGFDSFVEIREVYYNKDGEIYAISMEGGAPMGEDVAEMEEDIGYMMGAFSKPLLVEDDIVYANTDEGE